MLDFSKITLKEIDALNKDFVKNLNENDFISFYKRNIELGRHYKIGGKQKYMNKETPVYSSDSKTLIKKDDDTWEIWISALGPEYIENPNIVDEETFVKTMSELGMSKEKLDEFINYTVSWEDF